MGYRVRGWVLGTALSWAAIFVVAGGMYGCPKYRVWQQGLAGEAKLRESQSSRKVRVEEAKARLESAKFESQAEIERAKGVAEANRIIGDSLKGNDAYLRYLWIQGLQDGSSETIYIPTEANLPDHGGDPATGIDENDGIEKEPAPVPSCDPTASRGGLQRISSPQRLPSRQCSSRRRCHSDRSRSESSALEGGTC